ncbi:MAG: NADH-quinone oxidoreductase subunit H [Candidatus Riflebacteria bacterium]|nr:NADH-quinone oxidoreductase subunit H [Candidatus Riflebacteria bacterium]
MLTGIAFAIRLLIKIAALAILAPLIQGCIKQFKGRLQGRHGPRLLQPFFDLIKYARKEQVISRETSWVFSAAPLFSFAAVLTAALMVPWVDRSPWPFPADLILFVYLLAIPRFMMALAGLDAAGSFGGMASSRESAVSALAEPVLLLSLLTIALPGGSLHLEAIPVAANSLPLAARAGGLAAIAFYCVVLAEIGRIPVDNPDTHLELTMIHEGMILEYSGPLLGLLHFTHWIKQITLLVLLFNVFIPIGMMVESTGAWTAIIFSALIAVVTFLAKMITAIALLAITETWLAKLRLFQMMDLLGFAFVLSITALLFVATGV